MDRGEVLAEEESTELYEYETQPVSEQCKTDSAVYSLILALIPGSLATLLASRPSS